MKRISIILSITLILSFSLVARSQGKSKRPPLPANISRMAGETPDSLFTNSAVKSRLKTLLGKQYASFMETYEMKVPFKRVGNFLFSSGYLIHARTHLESAMAIDLVNKTIHAGIYREAMASRLFSEDKRPAPAVMKKWLRNLQANQ